VSNTHAKKETGNSLQRRQRGVDGRDSYQRRNVVDLIAAKTARLFAARVKKKKQTTHSSVVSVVFVAKAAASGEISMI
jgi:hypothetical protein